MLMKKIQEILPTVDTIHFWSDGCASQFKSKYCFHLIATQYPADVCLTWSYFESHHGKGPVDGIGGKVKSTVYNDVKAGLVILGDAQQFAAYANKRVQATEVVFVGSEEIHNDHPQIPGKVHEIPGTLRVRFIKRSISNNITKLSFYFNSQFSEKWGEEQAFREQVYHCVQDEVFNESDEGSVGDGQDQTGEIDVGDWVIVSYDSDLYPGEVLAIVGANVSVHAMAKSGGNWKWPEDDGGEKDIVWYTKDDVKCKISPPVPVGSRGQFKFTEPVQLHS